MLKLDISRRPDIDPTNFGEALAPGTSIDRYRLESAIAEDDFAIVYRALDLELDCTVAIKEYLPFAIARRGDNNQVVVREAAAEPAFTDGLRAFADDARALRNIQIPSVVRVLRTWQSNGTVYRAMPWLEGATLEQNLARVEVAGSLVAALVHPLLDSLQALHSRGRMHGRLCAGNVFMTADAGIVLLGFHAGTAAIVEASSRATACQPIEMPALDSLAARPGVPGAWSDLYAAAALMHLALCGRLPSPAAQRLLADDYKPLAGVKPLLHDSNLLRAIDWALSVLPDKRPRDVTQFRKRALGDVRVTAPQARGGLRLVDIPDEATRKHPPRIAAAKALEAIDAKEFGVTRPMVYGDSETAPAPATAVPAGAVPVDLELPDPMHDGVEISELPPDPEVASNVDRAHEAADAADAPDLTQKTTRGFDESVFMTSSMPWHEPAPEPLPASTPPKPATPAADKPLSRRTRLTLTLAVALCCGLIGVAVWWMLDPWLRPTLDASALGAATVAQQPPQMRAAPADAVTAPAAVPVAVPAPAPSALQAPLHAATPDDVPAARPPEASAPSVAPARAREPVLLATAAPQAPPLGAGVVTATPVTAQTARAPSVARAGSPRIHHGPGCSELLSQLSLGVPTASAKSSASTCQ